MLPLAVESTDTSGVDSFGGVGGVGFSVGAQAERARKTNVATGKVNLFIATSTAEYSNNEREGSYTVIGQPYSWSQAG